MKIIAITKPSFFHGEAAQIVDLCNHGVDFVHIRKPKSTLEEVKHFIQSIPQPLHHKLKLHYYKALLFNFPEIHYHHSSKSEYDTMITCLQSKSAHTFEELRNAQQYDYQFISPVFDSISKVGYTSNFALSQLKQIIVDERLHKVVALGGVCLQNVAALKNIPFYGIALLGALWEQPVDTRAAYIQKIKAKLE